MRTIGLTDGHISGIIFYIHLPNDVPPERHCQYTKRDFQDGDGLVHRSTKAEERTNALMEFKEFFLMMKNRISDGTDVLYFFRDLIAMITTVPESEWDTTKDPSTKLTKESTLRLYTKCGLSQESVRSIVYRLSPKMFIDSLRICENAVIVVLTKDYGGYGKTVTIDNVVQKLADCFIDIIRRAADIVSKIELEMLKIREPALEQKSKYGDYLRKETGNTCPMLRCGRLQKVAGDGDIRYVDEVGVIDSSKSLRQTTQVRVRITRRCLYAIWLFCLQSPCLSWRKTCYFSKILY